MGAALRGRPSVVREEDSRVSHIIIRPIGGRRFKYASIDSESRVEWVEDPEAAYPFCNDTAAEDFKKARKTVFGPDDLAVPVRIFSGQYCRFCHAAGPTMRRNAVECGAQRARVEFQCSHCNIVETASFSFESVARESLDG